MYAAPGHGIYAGRGWTEEEPLCPEFLKRPIWLSTVQNLHVRFGWGDWIELQEIVAGPDVFASTLENGCFYVSGRTWEHPVLAPVIGIEDDSSLWPFPTEYFVLQWFVLLLDTYKEIVVPRPSCVVPAFHQPARGREIVLALPAANDPNPIPLSGPPRIDDSP